MRREASEVEGGELLCTVRGILKKIKQSVLVGDRVRVAGIDWESRRGALHSQQPICAYSEC